MAKAKKKETLTPEERLQAVLVPDWEQPYKVPENWCWIHLLDSFENCTDSKKKIPQKEYLQDGKIAVVDQGQNLIGGYTNDREMIFAGNVPVIIFGDHTRCIKYIDFPFAQGADGIKVLKPKQFFNEKAFYYAFQTVIKSGHAYRITADDSAIEGSYRKVRSFAQKNSLFPQRVVAFYSGTNNKLFPNIKVVNTRYTCLCRDTLRNFLKSMNDDSERFIPNFPKRKYNYCEEGFTPVYLLSILCGQKSFEKSYLIKACHFDKVKYVDMVVNTNKVEQIFGRGRFEGDVPTGLYYLTDFIDYRFTDLLRRGFMYSSNGKSYFQITNIDSVNIDSIAILEFFEKLYSLFETRFEVTVTQGESNVKCSEMSEGQRQLIKILGMLGICKTEDCLVLMDEPDAYMNPRWKYEIKETMDNSLRDAINTQAIVATHDPLVINGVPKEFIRIFTHNENLVSNNGYYFTKVIVPTEDTEGMGIDGLLQSEYYGLSSVLDSETKDKMDEKHRLLIKKKDGTITDNEKYKLLELTNDLENMSFTRNIPTDSYYDEYVAAMHKIYSERPHVNLSAEDIAERNAKAEEILKGLLEK